MTDDMGERNSDKSIVFSGAWKRGTIYVSAIALAAAVAIGATSFELRPVKAFAESPSVTQQRLPSFAPLVKRVKPAVVSIRVKASVEAKAASSESDQFQEDNPFEGTPFEKFFNNPNFRHFHTPPGNGHPMVTAQGSGFFISPDGYLVTNNHVASEAVSLEVAMDDGKTYNAKVVGTDSKSDLALLKVEGRNDFPFVTLSRSGVEVGDWVVAMGNPFGLGGTVTAGIVSARGRDIGEGPYDDFLQIDAPVNKGNSGGPTFNQDGEVIGVNTAIYSPSGGSVGIAFDIPASTVERVVAQLKDHGHVTRGWLGVQIQGVTPEIADSLGLKTSSGALVTAPQDGGPAEKAGVKAGDLIVEVNGAEVKDARDLAKKIADIPPGADATLTLNRAGQTKTLTVKIGELPDKPAERADAAPPSSKTGMGELGIRVAPASDVSADESAGLAVLAVEPGGKAAEAGLAEGDIILKIGEETVNRPDDLKRALSDAGKAGRKNALALVKRNGDQRFIALPAKVG
ncbi:MAG: Do family serine endopeptidase [Rhodomicrobium sp.]